MSDGQQDQGRGFRAASEVGRGTSGKTPPLPAPERRFAFLWGEVYKGVEYGRLWLGWTTRKYKKLGW